MINRARAFDLVPLALGAWLVAVLFATWAARVPYPYDLEWMEGGMLVHAWRLQQGMPLYVEPGPDFIPFIYPPGYPALLAALGSVFGLGAPVGRMISVVSTLAAAGAIAFVVARHGRSKVVGVLGAVVFLGCYPYSGAFYDLVRNEAMFVALLAWAIALGLERRRGALEVAGLLLCAAFLVKQTAAVFGVPMVIGIGLRDGWRAAARFGIAAAAPALLVTGWLEWRTDGRFLTYLLAVPAAHPLVGRRTFPGTPWELAGALPVALAAIAGWLGIRAVERGVGLQAAIAGLVVSTVVGIVGIEGLVFPAVAGIAPARTIPSGVAFAALALGLLAGLPVGWAGRRGNAPYGLGVGATALVAAALMRGHHGGFVNVHIQMHWAVALAFALAVARLRVAWPGWAAPAVTAALFAGQIGLHLHRLDPADLVPTPDDRATCDAIVNRLRTVDEPVLSPWAPWLPVLAGHEPGLHLIALWDVEHPKSPFPDVGSVMLRAMRDHHWGTILNNQRQPLGYGVKMNYRVAEHLPSEGSRCTPKTGWPARPRELMVPP